MGLSLWSPFAWLLSGIFFFVIDVDDLRGKGIYNTGRWKEKK
jgi:hypothetical protein